MDTAAFLLHAILISLLTRIFLDQFTHHMGEYTRILGSGAGLGWALPITHAPTART